MNDYPIRHRLPHDPPASVAPFVIGSPFFLTICVDRRHYGISGPDAGRVGPLSNPLLATAVLESIEHRRTSCGWHPRLAVVMPDHVHWIASFSPDVSMRRTMSAFKRFLATAHGIVWQDGFFDHRLRTEEEAAEKAAYIGLNPVRKGLCATPAEWPFRRDWRPW